MCLNHLFLMLSNVVEFSDGSVPNKMYEPNETPSKSHIFKALQDKTKDKNMITAKVGFQKKKSVKVGFL